MCHFWITNTYVEILNLLLEFHNHVQFYLPKSPWFKLSSPKYAYPFPQMTSWINCAKLPMTEICLYAFPDLWRFVIIYEFSIITLLIKQYSQFNYEYANVPYQCPYMIYLSPCIQCRTCQFLESMIMRHILFNLFRSLPCWPDLFGTNPPCQFCGPFY